MMSQQMRRWKAEQYFDIKYDEDYIEMTCSCNLCGFTFTQHIAGSVPANYSSLEEKAIYEMGEHLLNYHLKNIVEGKYDNKINIKRS